MLTSERIFFFFCSHCFPESVVLSRIRLAHLCAVSAKLLVRPCYSLTSINVVSATNRRLCYPTVKSIQRSSRYDFDNIRKSHMMDGEKVIQFHGEGPKISLIKSNMLSEMCVSRPLA